MFVQLPQLLDHQPQNALAAVPPPLSRYPLQHALHWHMIRQLDNVAVGIAVGKAVDTAVRIAVGITSFGDTFLSPQCEGVSGTS